MNNTEHLRVFYREMFKAKEDVIMHFILISDIGTTSIKTSVFDEQLCCLGTVSGEYQIDSRPNGVIELDPENYWTQFCNGVAQVCKQCKITPAAIERIGITTQGETLIPVDANGNNLRNAIVWLDTRAAEEAKEIAAAVDPDEFYQRTGIVDCTAVWPVCKLLWLKRHEPDIYKRTKSFLLLEDYMMMRLTGRFVSNKAVSCSSGYYDILNDRVWTEILEQFDLDAAKLPEILDCGTVIGAVLPEVREKIGFSEQAVVVTTAMDQVSSSLGSGCTKEGIITETTGTVVAIAMTSDKSVLQSQEHITTYWHALKNKYLICPICMTGGMALKWFKDEFCAAEQQEAARTGKSVYALLDQIAAKSPAMSNGVLTIPYLNGTLQPRFNPDARGVFFGVGLENTRGDFTRSILEAIAFMLLENIEMIERQCAVQATQLRCCGGGCNSELWNQIKADVVGLPTSAMKNHETTSLGAAAITLLPKYGEEYILDLLDKANPARRTYLPDSAQHGIYEKGYQTFQLLNDALESVFKAVRE